MRIKIYIGLIAFVFFMGCSKSGPGKIEGYVFEEGTNKPIANAKVYIEQSFHYNTPERLESTTTDDKGYFKLKYFNKRNSYSYSINVLSDDAFTYFHTEFEKRKNKYTVFLAPLAYIKYRVKNNLSNDANFIAQIESGHSPMFQKFIKANKDTTFMDVFKINGNGQTTISWQYYYGSVTAPKTYIYINNTVPNDTITYLFELN